jgi:hypothetical protein
MPWTFETISEVFLSFADVNWITGIQSFINDRGENFGVGVVLKNIQDFLNDRYQWIQQESTF